MTAKTILLVAALLLAGCASVGVQDYAGNQPALQLERFFDGRLSAHGIIKDHYGRVIRYFSASIDASWKNGVGTLDERFRFDDGEQSTRVWTLTPRGDGRYIGSAADVVGGADLRLAGNSLFLDYVLRIPYDGDTIDLHIDDRMYLVSDTVLINESIMSKWGFDVGSITLVIEKQE